MATVPNAEDLWSVREYLRTSWSPDREYVDGHIEERNLGEKEHSIIQRYLTFLFMLKRAEWSVEIYPELRTQTQSRRFRVPDVLVTRSEDTFERYLTRPPLIAIEILSPEDTLADMRAKAHEYREFGVENVWIVDPLARVFYRYGEGIWQEIHSGDVTVAGTPIRIALSELFAELDRP